MRLPRDTENWTLAHFTAAMTIAGREFGRYEAKVDFNLPQEKQEDLYQPYRLARLQAIEIAHGLEVPFAIAEAEALP